MKKFNLTVLKNNVFEVEYSNVSKDKLIELILKYTQLGYQVVTEEI